MTTEPFVWVWLPGATQPVVAGRVRSELVNGRELFTFQYGRSFLENSSSISLFTELPLKRGVQLPMPGLDIAGVLLDATPDSWGRRVINQDVLGARVRGSDVAELGLVTYMMKSGSDRIGALDFQDSPTHYVPRGLDHTATLEQLLDAAGLIEDGVPLPAGLADALMLGSTVGGARPKALIDDNGRSLIAKFPSRTDEHPYVKFEAVAMELARRVGVNTASTALRTTAGRDVLLVERFDRVGDGTRRMQVSALTVMGANPDSARGTTSYPALAQKVRESFTDPDATLKELFTRVVVNVIVRNTDDHARNQAAFWDGTRLSLTPAYDINPSIGRRDSVASHPMAITQDGDNRSLLEVCERAHSVFHLTRVESKEIIHRAVDIVRSEWQEVAEAARLTETERAALWEKSILNPAIFWDA